MKNLLIASLVLFSFVFTGGPFLADSVKANVLELQAEETQTKSSYKDYHVLFDVAFKNDYVTPRGLLVTNSGLTTQIFTGFVLNVYKNPCSYLTDIALTFGAWNDIWSNQHNPYVSGWNEFDWFLGGIFTINNHWQFRAQFIEFLSPPHHFKAEYNAEFTLSYDDSHFNNALVFNPYVKVFWAISGDSTVVVGNPGATYYVEFGLIPTWDLKNYGICMTLSAPTWISVGPADFWNGGFLADKDENSNFGVFSTGLLGKIPLTIIPKTLGDWYLDAGFQYYFLINNNLLQAQRFTLGLVSNKDAYRNIVVASAGFGFEF